MLKELTSLCGISGNEDSVREYIKKAVEPYCDSIKEDVLGNLIAFKKGKIGRRVMLCAHMDEVGLIVSSITEDGYLKFKTVGGIDPRILPGKRVLVGENKLPGVIGIKAVHLTTAEERKKTVPVEEMYIDIGAGWTLGEVVQPGDSIAFDSNYYEFGEGLVKAKALDDRAGCAALISLLQVNKQYPFDLYVCFLVQEEVGLRGAKVVAQTVRPDIAVVAETTTCSDTSGAAEHEMVTKLGDGPVVSVLDSASYSDNALRVLLCSLAEQNGLKVQVKRSTAGGNDAGALQLYGRGTRTVVLSLPCRYIHSPASVISKADFETYCTLIQILIDHLADEIG